MNRSHQFRQQKEGGFTLIELMVVMLMLGLISAFALPSISSFFRVSLNTVTRKFAGQVKDTFNSAVLTGRVHRIVYDLEEKKYWVEVGPKGHLMETEHSKEVDESLGKDRYKDDEEEKKTTFELASTITREKVSLPEGVEFKDIISEQSVEPITEGVTFTHIFPNGLTEKTIIHLQDQDQHETSLVISTVIGKTRVFEYYIKEEEVFAK
tara:strand:- start:2845 stop:3471 length:627 start_codon:yes stop_codon:yes gene_type:complete